MVRITRKREVVWRRWLLLVAVPALVLSSAIVSISPLASAQAITWTHTSEADFAGGTGWNVDTASDPGSVTLPPSATSWIESSFNPGLRSGPSGSWDDAGLASPVVLKENGIYKMWYAGDDTGSGTYRIGYAISADGVNWTKPKLGLVKYNGDFNNNIVLDLGISGSGENLSVVPGAIVHGATGYHMWYTCNGTAWAICYAQSTDGLSWSRSGANPVLADPSHSDGYLSPAVIQDGSGFRVWYALLNSQGHYETWNAGSGDGVSWTGAARMESLGLGEAGSWFDGGTTPGTVHNSSGVLQMWYSGRHGSVQEIGLANSTDGVDWSASPLNPALTVGSPGTWDSVSLSRPSVLRDGQRYRMWFAGFNGNRWTIGTASSAFGERPVPPKVNPVVPLGNLESWDSGGMFRPSVIFKDGVYHMWYTGSTSKDGSTGFAIGYARSTDGVDWEKPLDGPVLDKSPSGWDNESVGFAWVIWDNVSSAFKMWFTGSDGVSNRIGLASSSDGLSWQKNASNPVTFMDDLTWFNTSDVRCPWVGDWYAGYVMYVGTRGPSNVSMARSYSWDGGLTWWGELEPFLTPALNSWEGDSVSCPVLAKNETGQTQWMWYEGSTGEGLPGIGGIGMLASNYYDNDFRRVSNEPVLKATWQWDSNGAGGPAVVRIGYNLSMWFHGGNGELTRIGVANSHDGIEWHEFFASPAIYSFGEGLSSPEVYYDGYGLSMFLAVNVSGVWSIFDAFQYKYGWQPYAVTFSGGIGAWDIKGRKPLAAFKDGTTFKLWYSGMNAAGQWSIGYASSLVPWEYQAHASNPVLTSGSSMSWDSEGIDAADVIHPGLTYPYEMWYSGFDGATWRIGFAFSNDGVSWTKSAANPVLHPSPIVSWDYAGVSSPRVIVEGGMYHMIYSGYDGDSWSLGHAFSDNGISWTRSKLNPLLGGPIAGQDRIVVRDSSVWKTDSGYDIWFSDSTREGSAIGHVHTPYLSAGTLISSPVDSGKGGTHWQTVNVTAHTSSVAKIGVAFRTGHLLYSWSEWSGDLHSSPMQPEVPRESQLQYRLTLVSITGESSATVEEIGGEYTLNSVPSARPTSPIEGICTNDVTPIFRWDYIDDEGDPQGGFFLEVSNETTFNQTYYSISLPYDFDRFTLPVALPEGIWFWRIQVFDRFYMLGPWSAPEEFCIDTVPPLTVLKILGPSLQTNLTYISGSTQISFEMTDAGSGRGTIWFMLDAESWQPYSAPFVLSPGYHVIAYNSTDEAGNKDSTQMHSFWVDVTPPETELIADSSSVDRNGIIYVTGTMPLILSPSDSESGPGSSEYDIDSVLNWTAGPLVQSVPPGPHTLYYRSTDGVGNVESINAQMIFRDDTPPGTVLVIGGPCIQGTPTYVTNSTWFNLTATDSGVGLNGTYYRIGGAQPYRYVDNFSIASEGLHILEYYSTDDLGNIERKHVLSVEVDSQGPATSPVFLGPSYQGPTASYVRSNTAIMFTGVDNSSGLQRVMYCLDGGPWIQFNSPFGLVTPGMHTVSFYGVDSLGNAESPKTMDVVVDDLPPSTTLALVGPSVQIGGVTYVDETTTAVLAADDAESGVFLVKYRLDGGAWNVYNNPIPLVEAGTRTVEINSIDNIGNIEQTQLFMFVVDAMPPVAEAGRDIAVFAPVQVTLDGLESTDDTVIVDYEWIRESDGSVVLSAARGIVSIQSPGSYVFVLRVRDPLGRESNDSMTVKVLQDPDSDRDTLPDVWEMEKFGNLTYGPGDDPDGDGVTNIEDYGQEGDDIETGLGTIPMTEEERPWDGLILVLMVLLGILAGVSIVQSLKIRDLKRKLDNREAERSIGFEDDESDEVR